MSRGNDTRRAARHNTDFKVQCEIPEGLKQTFSLASGNSCEVIAKDISESGMGLVSECFFPRGLIVNLKIGGKAFGLEGDMLFRAEICHCRNQIGQGYLCGVKFIDLSPNYKKTIAEFIADCERRKSPRIKLAD